MADSEKPQKPPLVLPPNLQRRMRTTAQVNQDIVSAFQRAEPFLLARFGGIEGKLIGEIILRRRPDVDQGLAGQARINAGIVPPNRLMVRNCAVETLAAGMKTDILAIWSYDFQVNLASYVAPKALCHLNSFCPILLAHRHQERPWTQELSGKKVLIVHPFVKSITKQLERRNEISVVQNLWPDDTIFEILKPPVTFAGEEGNLTWTDELVRTKSEIAKRDFDVALIGAGSYGMPLAGFVRDMGRKAIHFGGKMQLAFGILGARWENNPNYKDAFRFGWIRPHPSEIPKLHQRVDASSYW
ncbi:hypothetical protein [Roseivivax isoporae]|uniref:GT-D fold domain-containing protein n=1 Tax=Roseivivax isoporae TaxID=591206 RepID=UPI0012EB182C|nr:hypothetical protein [Roseivivax isoporae]